MLTNRNRLILYLYSTPNIVGSLLGILGLVLYFVGIIGSFWFMIVVGLYGIGVLATPKNHPFDLQLRSELDAEALRTELQGLVDKVRGRLPHEIYVKVESIKNSIFEILPYIPDVNSSDHNIFTIRQTVLEYLPEALESYLNLPKAYVNLHPVRDGKTATQLLAEQLTLLESEMRSIVQDVLKDDTQRLAVHGRFLQEKFGKAATW